MSSFRDAMTSLLLVVSILGLAGLLMFPLSPFVASQVDNESVESRVNVTNRAPEIRQIRLYSEAAGFPNAITLTEGTTTHVLCNATALDANGYQDFNTTHRVNATVWQAGTSTRAVTDDNNDHYTNTTCTITQINSSFAFIDCSIQMEYYANNGTDWFCNLTVSDLDGESANNESETTTVDPLFAINVTSGNDTHQFLDFGNMIPDNTTTNADELTLNITNTGNLNITFAIDGWANNFNDTEGLNCTIGDIPTDNLKYDWNDDTAFASMYTIRNWSPPLYVPIPNGTLWQRTDDADTDMSESTNITWWKINIPLGVKGFCNGTVIVSAVEI